MTTNTSISHGFLPAQNKDFSLETYEFVNYLRNGFLCVLLSVAEVFKKVFVSPKRSFLSNELRERLVSFLY